MGVEGNYVIAASTSSQETLSQPSISYFTKPRNAIECVTKSNMTHIKNGVCGIFFSGQEKCNSITIWVKWKIYTFAFYRAFTFQDLLKHKIFVTFKDLELFF